MTRIKTILVGCALAAIRATNAPAQQPTTRPDESAELMQKFQAEYPAACAKLEEAYSHVRIVAKESRYDRTGNFLWSENVEFLREGKLARGKQTVVDSTRTTWPAGSITVFGGDSQYYFRVAKTPVDTQFNVEVYGPAPRFDASMAGSCRPLYAPYCVIGGQSFREDLKMKELRLISAQMAKLDGRDVVEINTEADAPDGRKFQDHFYFEPQTWALAGSSVEAGPENSKYFSVFQQRQTYEPDTNPPKLKSAESWTDGAGKTPKLSDWKREITSVDFGPIPVSEFTLAAVGIKRLPLDDLFGPRLGLDDTVDLTKDNPSKQ